MPSGKSGPSRESCNLHLPRHQREEKEGRLINPPPNMMRRLPPAPIHTVLLLWSVCFHSLVAQQPAAAPPAPPARDFAAGFDQLRAFGLPDARGGTYVTFSSPMEYSERDTLLTGNAWVWDKGSNTPGRVLTGFIETKELADSSAGSAGSGGGLALLRMLRSGGAMPEQGKITGSWKSADLAKDLDKVLAKFKETPDPKKRNFRGNDFLDYEGKVNNPTRWLFFAAHAHRSGLTNQANQIVQALFATQEDPRLLLTEAVNELAEHGYEATWDTFQAKGDWHAYGEAVDALLARYGSAWQSAAGARLLAERLKERTSGKPAELQGPHLDEAGLQLAREIARDTPPSPSTNTPPTRAQMRGSETFWLWCASTNAPPAEAPAWERLTGLGPKAIPILAALAGDPWLIRNGPEHSSHEYQMGRSHRIFRNVPSGSASSDAVDEAEAQYQQLSRPRSRGEIAMGLLQAVFAAEEENGSPVQESDEESDPVPALRKAALEWYDTHQNSPPDTIALHFLSKGNSSMRMQAAQYLMPSTNAAHQAAMEALLRDAERFAQNQQLLSMYTSKFPDRARDILLEIAKIKGIDPNAPAGTARSSEDYEKRALLRLLESVRPADLSSLLKSIQEKKADHEDHSRLRMALKKVDPSTAYPQILQAAAATKFPESTAILLNSLSGLFQPSAPGKPAPTPPPVQQHAEIWRKLLGDQRAVMHGYQSGQAAQMGKANAAHLEELYTPRPASTNRVEGSEEEFDYSEWKMQNRPSVLVHLLGATGIDLLHKRALARLEGTPEEKLPALPSAKNVPPARAEEIAKQLSAGLVRAEHANALTLDERLWLAGKADEHPEWKPNVTNAAHRVTRLDIAENAPADLRAQLQGWKDQVLSVERLQPLVKLLCALPLTASNRQYGILIERMPALQGICVHVFTPDDVRHPGRLLAASGRMGRTFPKPVLVTTGDWMRWQWPLTGAAPTVSASAKAGEDEDLPEDEEDEDEPDSEDSFWEAVRTGLSGEDDPFAASSQSFYVPHPADDASDDDSSVPDVDF